MAIMPPIPNTDPNNPPVPPPTGVVGNAMPKTATYKPSTIKFGAGDTVEGRISGIINKNSALMKNAQTRSLQAMNQRGVSNSSMAIGAGEQALYDSALPIAQQDATNSLQSKMASADALNRAGEFGAGAKNAALNLATQGKQDIQSRKVQSTLDEHRDTLLADIQTQRDSVLQDYALAEQRAAHLQGMQKEQFLANATASRDKRLAAIDTKKMEVEQRNLLARDKTQAIEQAKVDQRRATLERQSLNLQGRIDQKILRLQDNQQAARDKLKHTYDLEMEAAQSLSEEKRIIAQAKAQQKLNEGTAKLDKQVASHKAHLEAARDGRLFTQETKLKKLETDSEKELLELKAQFDKDINASGQVSTLFAYTQEAISSILSNPDIPIANKQKLIEDHVTILKAGASVVGQINDIDIEGMVHFGRLEPGKN